MARRSIHKAMIAMAAGVAALLLIAAVSHWTNPRGAGREEAPITLTADERPPDADISNPSHDTRPGIDEADDVWGTRVDPETGRVVHEYRWGRLEKREEDIYDIEDPEFRLYLSSTRVVQLRADNGVITMPDYGHPESGLLRDNLTIEIYEIRPARRTDSTGRSREVMARIELDSAEFDVGLNQITSDGPVRMRSAAHGVEFLGRGLVLQFNDVQQRLEYLEITEVESLRMALAKRDALVDAAETDGAGAGPGAVEAADESAAVPLQCYRATFERDVLVTSPEGTITADQMLAYFRFDQLDDGEGEEGLSDSEARAADAVDDDSMGVPPGTAPEAATEYVTITAGGSMHIVPVDAAPLNMADDDEMLLQFVGPPVTMLGGDPDQADRITCSLMEYHHRGDGQSGFLDMHSSPAYPLSITSPAMGEVFAQRLRAWPGGDRVKLFGPGSMREFRDAAAGGSARGMVLTWEELAEVKFIEHAGTKQLSLAKFSGDVHADDPKYQMTGSQLDIHWEAVAGDDQLRASRIDARDAEVITDNQGTMSGATLEVDLAEDAEGRVVPTRIVGHDGVKVEDIEQALSARELDVSVVPKVDDEATVSDIGGRLRITSLTAEGEVKVHLKKQGMHIQGDRVVSADDMAWLNLFGVPVRIFDGGMALTVPELKLSALDGPRDQVRATSDGAGRFSYIQVPTLEEAGRQVDVVWKKSMVMSPARPLVARDAAGKVKRSLRTQVEVRGKAVAKVSDLKLEENTLRSETMSIWIAGMDPVAGAAGGTKDPALAAMGLGKHRTIDQLEARGDVSLISARWTDALHTELETRMQLTEAEYLDYDRVIERVLVEGASTLVIEDYRPEPDDQATKATPITGRGMTMLTSSDQLVIDGQKTQVTVKGSAHLSHWPADNKNRRLDLRADTLVADMKGIGGLEVMRGSEVESLRMDRVHASGNVVLKDFATGMTAYADQMVYDAKQKLVELMPLPNRRVMIEIEGQLMPTGNTHIIWDLKTNTFRGKGASGGL